MIVVKIELWKYGSKKDIITLGEYQIINDLSGNWKNGNYIIKEKGENSKTLTIKKHLRSKGFLPLVIRALNKIKKEKENEENKEV